MKVEDLFPVCMAQSCPQYGQHKHLLDHQWEMIKAAEKYMLCVGGYGSAKTLPACVIGVLLTLKIPGNFGFVGRRSYDKLHDSTQATFFEVVERHERLTGVEWDKSENRGGFYHRLRAPNGSQVIFRETKDLGRHLGPQYGWFLIDEAQEEPEATFTKIMGRLRLPVAGKYLKGMLLTNPPHRRHWLIKWFGDGPGVREVVDSETKIVTAFRYIKSATTQNPHLPPGYVESLKLLDPNEYRKVVSGELGFTAEGPPVYGAFKHSLHVGMPELQKGHLLTRGWDFGYRHPVCTWHDIYRCEKKQMHDAILHELVDHKEIEADNFGKLVVEETRRVFPHVPLHAIQDGGDHAGRAISDKGPGPIIRLSRPRGEGGYGLRFRTTPCKNIDPGLDFIRKLLKAGVCKCGQPFIVVHRNCRGVIEALAGGYHYPDRENKDKPVKDGYYDDIADSVRYAIWNFLKPQLTDAVIDAIERANRAKAVAQPGWAWMEPQPSEDEMAAEIARVKARMRA